MTLTCIVCPVGCRLTAEHTGGGVAVSGNRCPKGAQFAETELTAPMRTVTTTVRTACPHRPALPVRTNREIPKAMIPALLRALAGVTVTGSINIGDVIVPNVLNTGCDVVATDTLRLEPEPQPQGFETQTI